MNNITTGNTSSSLDNVTTTTENVTFTSNSYYFKNNANGDYETIHYLWIVLMNLLLVQPALQADTM